MSSKVKVEGLSEAVAKEFEDYVRNIDVDTKAEAQAVAKLAADRLKKTSPKGSGSKKGHYANGWKTKVTAQTPATITVTVYNAKKPGLTHLLEKGHAKVNGGRVDGIEHIKPAEEYAVETFEKNIKKRIQG